MLINIGDVADGVLINAIAVTGRRIAKAVGGRPGHRGATDLATARWFETYLLTEDNPWRPGLSPALTQRLDAILRGDEIQVALHELLAARLTGATETDAAAARQVLSLTLINADRDTAPFAATLAGYYDDQIRALVDRLESEDAGLLAQIRSEAFSARMINILGAIERHTAALSPRPNRRTETTFGKSYRGHVIDQHGRLEPPDFDRRHLVPIGDIYVPTTISEDLLAERPVVSASADLSALDVYSLAERLDRSVLLGDPGGGKTTAANVLMHYFARNPVGPTPFLVTLRDYASANPPERSVAGHVEHILETFYQCPAPAGLVDRLLLTGRAVVIFDGLDELLDTSRRADVTRRVERFCAEYPLVPVLVTSRLAGYEQARLDDRQFTCYRLAGFSQDQVGEYARKWFAQDADARADDAGTFLDESASVPDLRSNPLLLSLMCILYRGQGSLPRDRAEVYEQCAALLFRRWDARRQIHQDLRAGRLVEPTLRHLAWWLFTRDSTQPVVSERDLVDEATGFLHGRGFEAEGDARVASREFVEFCRGRAWVFSDAGITPAGERLYAFTHRTFLEYFAAAQLAYSGDSPEELARKLLPHIAGDGSWVVAELALQIKDRTSNGGAPRIYAALLRDRSGESAKVLDFLASCLRSVDPAPENIRELTRQIFAETCQYELAQSSNGKGPGVAVRGLAFIDLLINSTPYRKVIAGEIGEFVARTIHSGDPVETSSSLRVALSLPNLMLHTIHASRDQQWRYWSSDIHNALQPFSDAVAKAAALDADVRVPAVKTGLITTRQALDMPGGPMWLFKSTPGCLCTHSPYFEKTLSALYTGWPIFGQPAIVSDLTAFGEYLIDAPEPPWLPRTVFALTGYIAALTDKRPLFSGRPALLSRAAYLGAAAILLMLAETSRSLQHDEERLGPLHHLAPYLAGRQGRVGRHTRLPDLPVPEEFKQTFRDWAQGQVNVTA